MSHRLCFSSQIGSLLLRVEAQFSDSFIIISGENGSGKTTLLRTLAGLSPTDGTLIVNHQLWLDSAAAFTLPPQERRVGCVWHNPALLPWLTVADNIVLGAIIDAQPLEAIAEGVKIGHLLQRKPAMLSTGEAQRVALARAIYRQPAILLLDEPLSAQAPKLRAQLREWLRNWQQSQAIPVLMVSHDTEESAALGENHWHMREGRLWTGIESTTEHNRSIA